MKLSNILWSYNLKPELLLTVNHSCTTIRMNFGALFFAKLLIHDLGYAKDVSSFFEVV